MSGERHRVPGVADPATYRPRTGEIPESPGVYRFRDAQRRVIYVGKAKSLRQRLTSYFPDLAGLHPRTADDGDHGGVASSGRWSAPRSRRSSSSTPGSRSSTRGSTSSTATTSRYPCLAVTMGEEFPRVQVDARRQAQGHPLLRPVRARLGDPRDRRPAAARLPGPHLLRGVFKRAGQMGRPACSATSASARRRASAGSTPRSTADRRGLLRLHGRPDAARIVRRLEQRDARRRRRRWSTSGPRGSATTSGR